MYEVWPSTQLPPLLALGRQWLCPAHPGLLSALTYYWHARDIQWMFVDRMIGYVRRSFSFISMYPHKTDKRSTTADAQDRRCPGQTL